VEDPFEAYAQGLFDQALQGFTDMQVEYPEDPEVALNLGSSHYQMRNYGEADRAYSRAALAKDEALRQEALYNLGNSAFRQGRLEEAVELYKASLELDPEDEDAKFNLEFVRDEIRRRHEEAQNRQDQQQQQQQQDDSQSQAEQQESQQEEQDQQPSSEQQQSPGGQDSDQDGLPDEVERSGENPTDPRNPDSDGDSLPDGAEDLNRNGQVDPGETDPNKPDTDGDGIPDAQESPSPGGEAQAEPQMAEGLTPEEAERYLQALEEGRPDRRLPEGARRSRSKKDW
jgi:Ca-activated chloride channel family protein